MNKGPPKNRHKINLILQFYNFLTVTNGIVISHILFLHTNPVSSHRMYPRFQQMQNSLRNAGSLFSNISVDVHFSTFKGLTSILYKLTRIHHVAQPRLQRKLLPYQKNHLRAICLGMATSGQTHALRNS